MIHGSLKIFLLYILFFLFFHTSSIAEEKIKNISEVNLENLPATFEEDKEVLDTIENTEWSLNTKEKKEVLSDNDSDKIYVNLKALDKITAKTSSVRIAIGEKKYFGKLEIKPLKCQLSDANEAPDTVAYIQVKDLSSKNKDQVFLFNGWTFASSPTLRSIDHAVYDLWLVGCDNV